MYEYKLLAFMFYVSPDTHNVNAVRWSIIPHPIPPHVHLFTLFKLTYLCLMDNFDQ